MKELKALVVLTKEHSVVLLNLLESLNKLGSNGFYLLLRGLELLILLQSQLASSMEEMRSFFSLEFSASKASTLDTVDATFVSWLRYFEVI